MVVVFIFKLFIVLSVYVKNNIFLVSIYEFNFFFNVLYMVYIVSCKLYILVKFMLLCIGFVWNC